MSIGHPSGDYKEAVGDKEAGAQQRSWVLVKAIRLDEITSGEDIDSKEKSSQEWPSEISPALNLLPPQSRDILMLEEMAPLHLVPDGPFITGVRIIVAPPCPGNWTSMEANHSAREQANIFS